MKILSGQIQKGLSSYKLMKGENGTMALLSLNMKIDGPRYAKDNEAICLTKDQARHIYKKVESEGVVNVATMKQEIEEDKLRKDDIEDEINPYQNIIINNVYRDNPDTSQMEQWSIHCQLCTM